MEAREDSYGGAKIVYSQSKVQNKVVWRVNSLDLVLGLVGGFVGLIWVSLSIVCKNYQEFKQTNSLISSVYPTAPASQGDGSDGQQHDKD